MIDMKISELRLNVSREGELVIPAEVLREMGLFPSDSVYLAYLTRDGMKNVYQEFLLTSRPVGDLGEEGKIIVPPSLLEQAHIPSDGDIQILCLSGAILLFEDSTLSKQDLDLLLQQLRFASELTAVLPDQANSAIQQLEEIIREGAGDDESANC